MNAQSILYWAGKSGHEIHVVTASTATKVDLTSWSTARGSLDSVGVENILGHVHAGSDGEWSATATFGLQNRWGVHMDSLEAAVAKVREDHATMAAVEERKTSDPVYALEEILKNRDWYSHMSDDHGVWAAGMAEDREIKELEEKVGPEVSAALVAKYIPQG
jgi:hypothetical protein